jgi:hypothetical protein
MSRRKRNKVPGCPNCGTDLQAGFEFCPHCGQENHDLRVPFRTFAYEFLESITHFDTKLWNTLKVIVTKPGRLTKDFVEGKRARYVHPARFYVFTSFIFFALLTLKVDREAEAGRSVIGTDEQPDDRRLALLSSVLPDSVLRVIPWDGEDDPADPDASPGPYGRLRIPIDKPHYRATADRLRFPSEAVLDSLAAQADEDHDTLPGAREGLRKALALLPIADSLNVCYSVMIGGLSMSLCDRSEEAIFRRDNLTDADVDELLGSDRDSVSWFERRMIRSLGRMDIDSLAGRQRIGHVAVKTVSINMFILMPFTAVLLLWIFYRKRYYWEHLIFSIHIHTIYFLFFIVLLLLGFIIPGEWPFAVSLLVLLSLLTYLLISLRTVYAKPWGVTVLRFTLMAVPYLLIFFVLMVAGLLLGIITL